jgi:glycosyltransferase involved in cell wall biosynthesis
MTSGLNILMISDVYFPRVNGVSTSIATFRKALSARGHRVCLIAPDYGKAGGDDADIIRIPSRYLVLDPEDRILQVRRILELEAGLRKQAFDLVHIQTPFIAHRAGVELARRLDLPVVESCHTHFEEYLYYYVPFVPRPWMRSLARWLMRRQCDGMDAVIAPSVPMRDVLRRYGVKVPVSVISTGIDIDVMQDGSRERFCNRYAIDPARPILVHIGRIAHEKNIAFLLDVLAEVRKAVPNVLLVIAGDGPAKKALRRKTVQLGLQRNVHFAGYLTRGPDLWDCFRAGEAFVFASATETQGLVLLEAMALGVPVISTAVMGTKEILDAGKGALVADQTVDDFFEKIIRLLTDRSLRQRLATEGRVYVQEWSAERKAASLVDFYRVVLHGYAQGRIHSRVITDSGH